MPSTFGKFLDAVADALGFSDDKSRRQRQPRAPRPDPPRGAETESPAEPKRDGGPRLFSSYGFPITPDDCRVCGVGPAKPEHHNQFCSSDCEQNMGDRMDAWHDQFEERFGEGLSYDEWRAELEERHGKDYFDKIEERRRKE